MEIDSEALSGQILPEQHIPSPRSKQVNIRNAKLGQGKGQSTQNTAFGRGSGKGCGNRGLWGSFSTPNLKSSEFFHQIIKDLVIMKLFKCFLYLLYFYYFNGIMSSLNSMLYKVVLLICPKIKHFEFQEVDLNSYIAECYDSHIHSFHLFHDFIGF